MTDFPLWNRISRTNQWYSTCHFFDANLVYFRNIFVLNRKVASTLPLITSRNSTPKWKNGRKKRRKTSTEKWEVAFFESEENHPPPAINFEKCKKKFFGIITYCSSLSSLLFVFMVQLKVNGNKWVIFSLCFTCGSRCKKFHNHIGIVPDPFAANINTNHQNFHFSLIVCCKISFLAKFDGPEF